MKPGWTRFWLCTSALLVLRAGPAVADQQSGGAVIKHANELTLAGLRPGKDSLKAAAKRYNPKYLLPDSAADSKQWRDTCVGRVLDLEMDGRSLIQTITVSALAPHDGKCDEHRLDPIDTRDWVTGSGLKLGDPENRVTDLYGEPQESGPAERDGTELEFLDYRFKWAGPNVPQSMRVYCARDTGRVLEITLANSPLAGSQP